MRESSSSRGLGEVYKIQRIMKQRGGGEVISAYNSITEENPRQLIT